ncbi:hypothetical protein ACFVWP_46955 [Streptomyces sp. NPDC058175]|uniref:hypothetical protein n=1 Tax=Streptomyces sp. NPDC058175 TaxID=3346367 RepID=UPI0036E6F14F
MDANTNTRDQAQQFLAAVEDALRTPTSFRNDELPDAPAIGTTPPVVQPDTRRVPQWATGIAVASIGIGAGVTGIGCGAWLIFQGLSSVTLLGVIAIAAPFVGIATVAMAIGAAISKAKRASTTNIYRGPVVQDQRQVTTTTRGVWAQTRNQLPK